MASLAHFLPDTLGPKASLFLFALGISISQEAKEGDLGKGAIDLGGCFPHIKSLV